MKKRILVVLSLILAFGVFAAAYAYSGTNTDKTIQVKVEKSDEDCCQKGADCCQGSICCHKKK